MSVFGIIRATTDVEDAVLATIELWVDTYLAEVERQHSITVGTLQRPRSYNATYDGDNWPEGQLPSIAIVCPGTAELPEKRGSGEIGAWFSVSVDIIVEGTTEKDARRVAGLYSSALASLMVQHADLGGFATDVDLHNIVLRLPDADNRTLAIGTTEVRVFVDNIANAAVGPIDVPGPPESPAPAWPTVTTTSTTVLGETLGS